MKIAGYETHPAADLGRVYFVQSGGCGPVKIGWTRGPVLRRLAQLQTSHPSRLLLLADVPGTRNLERGLHATYGDLRMSGEWFRPEAELMELVNEIAVHQNNGEWL